MARTYHHSQRWGRDHPWNRDDARHGCLTTPNWWVSLCMNRPGRLDDRRVLRLVMQGRVDEDSVTFGRTGGHKPHVYYW